VSLTHSGWRTPRDRPDIGTGASLFRGLAVSGRLRSLVVGQWRRRVSAAAGWVLKDWVEAPDLEGYRTTDPRQIVSGALTDIERYALLDFVREDYLSAYEGDRFVESMRYVRTYPAALPVLRDLLPEIQTPVQIIAGARDPAVPPINGEFLHERLPNSKLDILDAGHLPGKTQPTSTPRWPRVGGTAATRPSDRRQAR